MNKIFLHLGLFMLLITGCTPQQFLYKTSPKKNQIIGKEIEEDKNFVRIIDPYKKKMENIMNRKLSYTDYKLDKTEKNNALGNLLADFTYEGAEEWSKQNLGKEINMALINYGGIRNTINKGDILVKNIFEVMPFENELVIVELTKEDIKEMIKHLVEEKKNHPVSHFYLEIENEEIKNTYIKGIPFYKINKDEKLYIATSDFLAHGMDFFLKGKLHTTGIKLRDLYIHKFSQQEKIIPNREIRMRF